MTSKLQIWKSSRPVEVRPCDWPIPQVIDCACLGSWLLRLDSNQQPSGHADHYGGLIFLLQNSVRIGRIFFEFPSEEVCNGELLDGNGCVWNQLMLINSLANQNHIPMASFGSFTDIDFGDGGTLRLLARFSDADLDRLRLGTNINNTSAIMRLDSGDSSAMFTGDAMTKVTNWIVTNMPEEVHVEGLKVPHHCAGHVNDDDLFVREVHAEYFVVPVDAHTWNDPVDAHCRHLLENLPEPQRSHIFVTGVQETDIVHDLPKDALVGRWRLNRARSSMRVYDEVSNEVRTVRRVGSRLTTSWQRQLRNGAMQQGSYDVRCDGTEHPTAGEVLACSFVAADTIESQCEHTRP